MGTPMAQPATVGTGLAFCVNFPTMLAIQERLTFEIISPTEPPGRH